MNTNTSNTELNSSERSFIEQIFRKHQRLMFTVVRKYLDRRDDQEDIVQDTMLRLCSHVKTLRELSEHALVVYIAQAVRHVSFNFLERRRVAEKNYLSIREDWMKDQITQDEYFVGEEQREEYRRFRDLMDGLSEEERALLYEKYVFRLSYAEMAERHQCTEEAMRMRVYRLRKRSIQTVKTKQEDGI